MADELDRLFGRLVESLVAAGPGRLAVPFIAAELYERLVPYRSNRARLNVATHQDYEMTVLRLLAGERGYAQLEPADVQDALRREAESQNPDTGVFRSFPDAQVMINRLAAERFLKAERAFAPPLSPAPAVPEGAPDQESENEEEPEAAPTGSHFAFDESEASSPQCAYCGGTLPAARKVNFCPHCGQPPSGELRCPACGSEVDVGWAYCVGCGRSTGFE
ncbi:MAG TPA: zinc ribbon domain-containing protein [Gemmatimonadales bacterium]|nr:zinc ribbon domain-containing protein [Gemmatimonadales bacterium]